jgi:hypothetical protein
MPMPEHYHDKLRQEAVFVPEQTFSPYRLVCVSISNSLHKECVVWLTHDHQRALQAHSTEPEAQVGTKLDQLVEVRQQGAVHNCDTVAGMFWCASRASMHMHPS